jgi:hypothetical protein
MPSDPGTKPAKPRPLLLLQDCQGLNQPEGCRLPTLGCEGLQRGKHIGRELSVKCALLHQSPFPRAPQPVPHFDKLAGQQRSKQRPDANSGVEVAAGPNPGLS